MILVVGNGPSSYKADGEWIDRQAMVVRLSTGTHKNLRGQFTPHIGSKVDVICAYKGYREVPGIPFWHIKGELSVMCIEEVRRFGGTKKPSTGACACLIARYKYPHEEIGAIGFDCTLGGNKLKQWKRHDAIAEGKCLLHHGVVDYGDYGG